MESGRSKPRVKLIDSWSDGYGSEAFAGQDAGQIRQASIIILQTAENTFQKKDEKDGLNMVRLARQIMCGPPDGPEARLLCLLYRWIGDRLVMVGRGRAAMDFHCLYEKFHKQEVAQWPWFQVSDEDALMAGPKSD